MISIAINIWQHIDHSGHEDSYLLLEDGTPILLEDGTPILLEVS